VRERVAWLSMSQEDPYIPPFVRRVMRGATKEELLEATSRLRRYLKAMYGIYVQLAEQKAAGDSEQTKMHGRLPTDSADPSNP